MCFHWWFVLNTDLSNLSLKIPIDHFCQPFVFASFGFRRAIIQNRYYSDRKPLKMASLTCCYGTCTKYIIFVQQECFVILLFWANSSLVVGNVWCACSSAYSCAHILLIKMIYQIRNLWGKYMFFYLRVSEDIIYHLKWIYHSRQTGLLAMLWQILYWFAKIPLFMLS